MSPKEACFGAEHGGRCLFPFKPPHWRWKFMRVGGLRHEGGASILMLESPWPFLQRSFCLTSSDGYCHHGRVSATLPKLPPSALNTFMHQPHLSSYFWFLSGVLVNPPFVIILSDSTPVLLISRNHLDSVLPPWPISNSCVVSRRMTWRVSTL